MSKEQVFTHNQVKSEFNLVIGGLAKQSDWDVTSRTASC